MSFVMMTMLPPGCFFVVLHNLHHTLVRMDGRLAHHSRTPHYVRDWLGPALAVRLSQRQNCFLDEGEVRIAGDSGWDVFKIAD